MANALKSQEVGFGRYGLAPPGGWISKTGASKGERNMPDGIQR